MAGKKVTNILTLQKYVNSNTDTKTPDNPAESNTDTKTQDKPETPTPLNSSNTNDVDPLPVKRIEKTKPSYMQINVTGYEDYLYRMSKYNDVTMTKYIAALIKADSEAHVAEYESLKSLKAFDKPYRESPNKKKHIS